MLAFRKNEPDVHIPVTLQHRKSEQDAAIDLTRALCKTLEGLDSSPAKGISITSN